MGHPAYDVASLAQDARVDLADDLELRLLGHYAKARRAASADFDMAAFAQAYAILGAQRSTKILGIFARLDKRDGKPQYRVHLPRMTRLLRKNLAHPALAPLRAWYAESVLGSSPMPDAIVPQTAMVFAAGLGTRMRPVTDTIPKPLVVVGGRTLLDHMLDRFADASVGRAIVNVHYRADQIEAALRDRAAPHITVSDEREKLLDQGGGIAKVLPQLGETFFIANTDALWTDDGDAIAALRDAWDPAQMDVLLLVAARDGSVGVDWPGDFHLHRDGRLARRSPEESSPYVYAGVGIMKASLFAPYTQDVFRLAPLFFDAAARGRLHGVALHGRWLHVGTPGAIAEAEAALREQASDAARLASVP